MTDGHVAVLVQLTAYVLVGVALQVASRFWPLREDAHRRELLVDYLGFGLAYFVYSGVYGRWVAPEIAAFDGLGWMFGVRAFLATGPEWLGFVLFYLIYDFFNYWLHRLNHTRPLWSTHAFHHSPRYLDWVSGMRASPFHQALPLIAFTLASMLAPISGPFLLVAWVYNLVHFSFLHSNIRVNSRLIKWFFITSEHHFVHHATDPRLGNTNFGFTFTLWDRLFGTYTDPSTVPKDFPIGFHYEIETARLMIGLSPKKKSPAASAPFEA